MLTKRWCDGTYEALEFLFWLGEMLTPPYTPKLNGWDDRGAQARARWRLKELARRELLRAEQKAGALVYRLTASGRTLAAGADPPARWQRAWDGQWRLVVFDLPQHCQRDRKRLLHWLRHHRFGFLQNSTWVGVDSLATVSEGMGPFQEKVETLTILEARCANGYRDEAIVQGAWDFGTIQERYRAHMIQAHGELRCRLPEPLVAKELRRRLQLERVAWANALELDPLLPERLLPKGYLGQQAWQLHRAVMRRLLAALCAGVASAETAGANQSF